MWQHHTVAADLYIHYVNLLFHHIHGALFDGGLVTVDSEHIVMFKKWIWDSLSFLTWNGYGQKQYSTRLCHLKDAQLVLRASKCGKKISPTPSHHWYEPGWVQGVMLFTPNSDPAIWAFSNLLLYTFCESVQSVPSVSCSELTGMSPNMVFCCCNPSSSRVDMLFCNTLVAISPSSLTTLLWNLTLLRDFLPCCSLAIFSSLAHFP